MMRDSGAATRLARVRHVIVLSLMATTPLSAQTDSASRPGAASGTPGAASDIARHLTAIAKLGPRVDSSQLRIEPAAAYAADQFGQWGLGSGPSGESASENPWLQTYPVPGQRRLDYDTTAVMISTFVRKGGVEVVAEHGAYLFEMRRDVRLPLATAAPLVSGSVSEGVNGLYLGIAFGPTRRPKPIIVAGRHTPASAAKVAVEGKVVFYVPPAGLDSISERQIADTLARAAGRSRGVVVVTEEDSAHFAARSLAARRQLPLIDQYLKFKTAALVPTWTIYVRPDSLRYLFTLAGLDLSQLRRESTPVAREALPLSAWFSVATLPGVAVRPMAANAVGVLEGRDSALKRQYVIVSAHAEADAGADASGVAALLDVARAFSAAGTRPKRSIMFVVTSGAEREFAGAEYMAAKMDQMRSRVVASLTLDLVGHAAADSVAIDGLEEIDFGTLPGWVTGAHPDVGLATVSGSVLAAPCADHCAFVRRKVPSLYIHAAGAVHGTTVAHGPPAPMAIETAYTARVARLAFYLAEAIANAPRSARWSPEAAKAIGGPVGVAP